MMIRTIGLLLIGVFITCCSSNGTDISQDLYKDVKIVGAMKNVMRKGELGSSINLDTISSRKGLYGLGPESFLTGELLINDGKSYVSRVVSDSTMTVIEDFDVSAPFLVYANVSEWKGITLPSNIKSIQDLEKFIDERTKLNKRPFAFKVIGRASKAVIHIQNLPAGTKVSSPEEAHQGQVNYDLNNQEVEIVGFFSTQHKGVFTHHDSYLHMHLITKDEQKMGHLDELEMEEMTLYLPQK